jgi:hypothetical protein
MDAGNTLGAIVFLAAGTWLGWKVVSGQAANFLAAMASGKGGSSGKDGSGGPGTPAPATVQHGSLAGVPFTAPDPYVLPNTPPTVFGDVFGQNGPLNGGAYGPYSWDYSNSYAPLDPLVTSPHVDLGSQTYSQIFGLP